MDTLLVWDQGLFLFLNGMGSDAFDGFWITITDKRYTIGFYAILTTVMGKWMGWEKTLWMILAIALLITFTDQVTNLFKHGFKRLRPCHEGELTNIMRQVKPHCGGYYGYFSGHASNSFAISTFFVVLFSSQFKMLRLLFIVASLVAYSRIYIGVHYPLDIISGAFFGILGGWIFAKLYLRFIPNPI
jgi:undecaprenyl-diphosphatase